MAEGKVSSARDVQDEEFWAFVKELIHRGSVRFLYLGTPCSTFSMARAVKMKNGPRPLRSLEHPLGLPSLGLAEKQQALLGNMLLDKSVEAALAVLAEGGDFSLENPREKSSLEHAVHPVSQDHVSNIRCIFRSMLLWFFAP